MFLALRLVPYSQLGLCVDECEQTLLRVERQKASAMPFPALETHCGGGGGAQCLHPCPGSAHMLI